MKLSINYKFNILKVKRRNLPLDDAEYGALSGILNGDKTFKDKPKNQDSSLSRGCTKNGKVVSMR